MIDLSTHISGTQSGLNGSSAMEAAENPKLEGPVKKGGSKDQLGVFGKLLAGLLRRSSLSAQGAQGVQGPLNPLNLDGAHNAEKTAFLEKPGQAGKKAKLPAALQKNGAAEKQGGETRLSSDKKTGKFEKKAGQPVQFPFAPQAGPVSPSANEAGKGQGLESAGQSLAGLQTAEGGPEKAGISRLSGKKPEHSALDRVENRAGQSGSRAESRVDSGEKQKLSSVLQNEKPAGGRAEDAKKPKRKERIIVEDIRTQRGQNAEALSAAITTETFSEKGPSQKEIVLELRPSGGGTFSGDIGPEKPGPYGSEGALDFEGILANQLSGGLSNDIVRQAAFVLRDGGEGTIRLALKPETLGKVKIHLEMAENKISGHIVVESEEALRAFEREIHTLEQAFRDSGFNEASLDTALDSGNGWNKRNGEAETEPFYSGRLAASSYEAGSGFAGMEAGSYSGNGFFAVNVLI